MTQEFDPYTRDDLIAEINAIRLKFQDAVIEKVLEETETERENLRLMRESFINENEDKAKDQARSLLETFEKAKKMWQYRRNISAFDFISMRFKGQSLWDAEYTIKQFIDDADKKYGLYPTSITQDQAKEIRKSNLTGFARIINFLCSENYGDKK